MNNENINIDQNNKITFIKKSTNLDEYLNEFEYENININRKVNKTINNIRKDFFKNYICINDSEDIYIFNNEDLDEIWRTHPSFKKNPEFQRLEFLGDRLLLCEIAKILFEDKFKDEGDLTLHLSELVKNSTLSEIGKFLIPKIKYSGSLNASIIGDCLEAWIGAIYIDGGDVEYIIKKTWGELLNNKVEKNPKNKLQEIAQEKKIDLYYDFIEENNRYKVILTFGNLICNNFGRSKQEASINAAIDMLNKINLY